MRGRRGRRREVTLLSKLSKRFVSTFGEESLGIFFDTAASSQFGPTGLTVSCPRTFRAQI